MTMKNFVITHSPVTLAIIFLAVFTVGTVSGHNQDIAKLNRFVQSQKANTASMQIFREGRDFIESQNWQKAAEKFNDFIKGYPKDRDLDAALYWYAYALQKQGLKEEAVQPLVQLMKRFPNSSWRREAEATLVVLGRKDLVDQRLEQDNCEIKILALQSLFQADEERAIGIVLDSLKTNPPPCQGFQAAAVSMLGHHRSPRAIQILLDIARSNPDLRLRLTAIKRLGDQHNEQITDELIKLYDADRTKEIRAQILRALSEREEPRALAKLLDIARTGETPEIRIEAMRRLNDHGRISLDDLLQLYTSETNIEIKRGLLRTFAENKDPRAQAKLLDIARGGESIELRTFAIRVLGGRDDEPTVSQLVAMYDSDQNPQIKATLMRAFGDSKQKVAVRKLMTIARSDPSVELRKLAVRYLGDSKDPEALKFLEDLLK
jgi:HEAT repeat protein